MVNPQWRLRAGGFETAIWVAKIAFCFLGVLFVGGAARTAVPAAAGAFASSFPGLRAALLSRIRPPYLFIAVHFIILVIWKIKSFESSRSSNINRMPSSDSWSDVIPQSPPPAAVSSPDLAEPSASDASCLTTDSVERSTASSMSSIEKSAEPESDRGATVEEEEDVTAALAIAGVENDSMEATWKAIIEQPSRTAAPPSAAALPSPSRRGYRRLDPPPPPAVHDEWTQRFEEFIQKNHQQIRFHTADASSRI